MNQFSISDIENLCGIRAHTLRIWEQRYGIFIPRRKTGNHRIYSDQDLKELLRISFLYHNKFKISKIAKLSKEEIQQQVDALCARETNYPLFINRLIDASIDLDSEKFEKIVNNLVDRFGIEKCIHEVFLPFLHRIGLLWMTDHVIPAQEHFASYYIRKKIICAIDRLPVPEAGDYHIALFTPPGEHHEIPLLVVNYYLRKQNIRTAYFGAGVAVETIKSYNTRNPLTHIYMHVITNLAGSNLHELVNCVCGEFPDKKILLSGPASKFVYNRPLNLFFIGSMEEMIHFSECPATVAG
jgi:DNA-binding transcriptional MerR regulator